jgi:dienelactone hydrolase
MQNRKATMPALIRPQHKHKTPKRIHTISTGFHHSFCGQHVGKRTTQARIHGQHRPATRESVLDRMTRLFAQMRKGNQ